MTESDENKVATTAEGSPCQKCEETENGYCHIHSDDGGNVGRPDRQFTQQEMKFVEIMRSTGSRIEDICEVLDCSDNTLRKHCGDILDKAKPKADAKVKGTLFQMATSGKNLGATIFWLKTQCGWVPKEKREIDHTSSDGSMSQQSVIVLPDNGRVDSEDDDG